MTERKDTSLSVDVETAERIRALAREDDRPVSSMIRKMLRSYEVFEKQQKQNSFRQN